jgi:catalase
MNGSGVHTYSFINSAGKVTYVKFHWVPTAGEAQKAFSASLQKGLPHIAVKAYLIAHLHI